MDEKMFSNVNTSVVEISSTNEGTSRLIVKRNVDVSVPEKNVGKKNMRKKTANVKNSQHITDEKAGYDAYQKATDTNIEKNRKRKADTVEESERNTEQESEDNEVFEGTDARDFESNENDIEKNPNMKSARKEKTENVSKRKITDNSNAEDGNAENTEESKNDNTKISVRKVAVHPPVSEMVLDSFRTLKKRNGLSVEEISKCITENFHVNINRIKPHIKKFLQKGVADGLFDQVKSSGGEGKFKIKKTRKVNKQTVKSKVTKFTKRNRDVKKFATGTMKGTGKVTRKVKNDKVKQRRK